MKFKYTNQGWTLLLFCLVFCMSCQKDLNLDDESFNSQIVVNSLISPGSPWEVNLTRSKSIFQNDIDIEILDAEVKVIDYISGESFKLYHSANGIYVSKGRSPQIAHEYELKVSAPELESVFAYTYVPTQINVAVEELVEQDIDGKKVINVNFEIIDNPDEENYYIWELVDKKLNFDVSFSDIFTEDSDNEFTHNFELETRNSFTNINFINNSDFNENTYSTTVISPTEVIGNGIDSEINTRSIYDLKIRSVSKDFYEYLRSFSQYSESNSSVSTPTEIQSNIFNGLGIFGAYSETIIKL